MINYRMQFLTSAVLGLALAARVIIPAGYMPGNLLSGEFMVLCPSGGGALFLDEHHVHSPSGDGAHAGYDGPLQRSGHGGSGEKAAVTGADDVCPIGSVLFAGMLPASISNTPEPREAALPIASDGHAVHLPRQVRPFSPRDPPPGA